MISKLESNGAKLSLGQKILLAETGTVEQVLSILVQAPVQVSVTKQQTFDGVIKREAVISKKGSNTPLIRARSKAYMASLPTGVVQGLLQKKGGIGTILHNARLETRRELVRFGFEKGHPYRVYQIIHRGDVAFEIREDIMI